MNNLVFLSSPRVEAELFTTEDVIVKCAGIERELMNSTIRTYQNDLWEFGLLGFKILKLNGCGRPRKVWHFNKNKASLLIAYLENTKPVCQFRKGLIRQFDTVQWELIERRTRFELGKEFSKRLCTTVAEIQIDQHGHEFSNFNRLVCRQVLGAYSTKLRKVWSISRDEPITPYLTSEEVETVRLVKQRVTTFLDAGMDHQQIKNMLNIKGVIL